MNTKEKILKKYDEYKTNIAYSFDALNDLLDKQIITKMEYHSKDLTMSLLYNDFGAYLRVWQDGTLEYTGIKLV